MAWDGLPVRIIVGQPIGIDVMGLKEMQTVCKKIHQVYKIGSGTSHPIGNGDSSIIT